MTMRTPILSMPASAFDLLQGSAERYGGIGAGNFNVWDKDGSGVPFCVIGHAHEIAIKHRIRAVYVALDQLNIGTSANDAAVRAINSRRWFGLRRLTKPFGGCDGRVSFTEWCAELYVVRGAR